jgi:hypothetical protein
MNTIKKCYYCQSNLFDYECLNCPVKVKHYYYNNELHVVELYYGKYAVDIYLTNIGWENKKCYIVDIKTHYNKNIELEEDPGITPYNIKEKLKLILTFR